MHLFLYNLAIRCYSIFIHLAAAFIPKAKAFIVGRRHSIKALETFRNRFPKAKVVWIHCASLGEFEQGRPLIEKIKAEWPNQKIVLTFFSPSGYDVRKNYPHADFITYLPIDTAKNAHQFIEILQPNFVIFVKYEFWYHHLSLIHQKGIPTILISAIFKPNQVFFTWYGGLFRKLLAQYDQLFVQDETSQTLLNSLNLQNHQRVGDTRVDRVAQISISSPKFKAIEKFVGTKKIFIIGSSWPPGEDMLCSFFNKMPPDWKIIIAPHEISKGHLLGIEKKFALKTIRYSAAKQIDTSDYQVLIIDNIGMLASLYRYGTVAYIGGGFGVGIHNTLEPATFGLPIIFGPKYKKFREAITLQQQGGAFVIRNESDFQETFKQLNTIKNYKTASNANLRYIEQNKGATEKIVQFITPYLST